MKEWKTLQGNLTIISSWQHKRNLAKEGTKGLGHNRNLTRLKLKKNRAPEANFIKCDWIKNNKNNKNNFLNWAIWKMERHIRSLVQSEWICYRQKGKYIRSNLTTLRSLIIVHVSSSLKESIVTGCGNPTFQTANLPWVWINCSCNCFFRSTVLESAFALYRIHFCLLLCLSVNIKLFSLKTGGSLLTCIQLVLDHMPQKVWFVSHTCCWALKEITLWYSIEKYLFSLNKKAFIFLFSHKAVILPLYTPLCTSTPLERKFS